MQLIEAGAKPHEPKGVPNPPAAGTTEFKAKHAPNLDPEPQ